MSEDARQRCQEDQRLEKQQHAAQISNCSSKLRACQQAALEEDQKLGEKLAQTCKQLKAALEYRKKAISPQAEIKQMQQTIAELEARSQHAEHIHAGISRIHTLSLLCKHSHDLISYLA